MLTILKLPSPNFFTPAEMQQSDIQAVVLHGTAGPVQSAISWLRNPRVDNPGAAVSSNYVISKLGVIYELVDWQAGKRAYANGIVENYDTSIYWLSHAVKNNINPNWLTVSIEHEASKYEMEQHMPMTDKQFDASIEVTAFVLKRNGLKASHQTIIGHNQISGVNKFNCPGVIFPPAYTEQLIIRHSELG